jgi:predicted transcriptional regulator of viral defense system
MAHKQYQSGTVYAVPGKYWDALMDVAVDNGGYVTPSLVAPHGVPAVELRKMVSRGTLQSAARGVYRIPSLPYDPLDEFILARMWAGGRGVISHDSALLVHELCDINPTKVHLTIPTSYRISRSGGERYVIHHGDLEPEEITRIDAVTLTTIRRTLTDSLRSVPAYLTRAAIETARERGSIPTALRDHLLRSLDGDVVQ